MDWDDLKFLMAVADGGGLEGAANKLKTEQLAVSKGIRALESSLNCELVAADLTLTASGERALAVARAIESQIAALVSEVGGERGEITGTLCVTSTEGFVRKAMPALEALKTKYPALDIDLMVSSHVVDLKRREADIAVRFFRDEQDGLAMRKLGTMGWSLYGSEKYIASHPRGANLLDGQQVIGFTEAFNKSAGGRWMTANVPADVVVTRVGGLRPALDAAIAHQGLSLVPCYLTSELPLVRFTPDVLATSEVYAVFLAARRDEARMRVVTDALAELFEHEHAAFAG